MHRLFAAQIMIAGLAAGAARAEDLSYHGWRGAADFVANQFIGCHLDSPQSIREPRDPIRLAAERPGEFYILFIDEFENPQPQAGLTMSVKLALVNGENVLSDDWSNYGYRARVLSNGARPDGKPFTRVVLGVSAHDKIVSPLKDARYLKVFWPPKVEGFGDINFWTIDLRHRSISDPKTLLGVFDTNDTYGAIQELMACVSRHAETAPAASISPPPPNAPAAASPQAQAVAPAWQPPLPPAVSGMPPFLNDSAPGLNKSDLPPILQGGWPNDRDCSGGGCRGTVEGQGPVR
jgi:hypothetical protein